QEQERQEAVAEAVEANEATVRIANERYTNGLDSFLNVLFAQQALYQTEDALIESQSAELIYLVSLYKALGGGWDVFEEDPVLADDAAVATIEAADSAG